jgi:hypothetical protein
MTPLVAIFVFFLRGVPYQLVDERQRFLVLHANDGFHAHGVEEQRLAAILRMRAKPADGYPAAVDCGDFPR